MLGMLGLRSSCRPSSLFLPLAHPPLDLLDAADLPAWQVCVVQLLHVHVRAPLEAERATNWRNRRHRHAGVVCVPHARRRRAQRRAATEARKPALRRAALDAQARARNVAATEGLGSDAAKRAEAAAANPTLKHGDLNKVGLATGYK